VLAVVVEEQVVMVEAWVALVKLAAGTVGHLELPE
jgi:hypothetical protein